jgi:hypothetical protein
MDQFSRFVGNRTDKIRARVFNSAEVTLSHVILSCVMRKYRGIQYHIVQTASPPGWRWTIELAPALRSPTGQTTHRTDALRMALDAIDTLLPPIGVSKIIAQRASISRPDL